VKSGAKSLVGLRCAVLLAEFVVMGVCGNHLSVFHTGRNFDWTSESEVVVALVVCDLLDFGLGQVHGVHDDRVMNRLGSGSSGVVIGDHEEVKEALAIVFNNTLIYNRTWTRVADISVGFLKKSK
jgi:hypothetical protein